MDDPSEIPDGATRSIPINVDVGPVVDRHRVVLQCLSWFPDLLAEGVQPVDYLDLAYRFVPPLTEEERYSASFAWKVWELRVQDELGTNYDASTGGLGPQGGDREIHPAPPSQATVLTLSVGAPRVSAAGEQRPIRIVKQIQVDLTTGTVSTLGHAGV